MSKCKNFKMSDSQIIKMSNCQNVKLSIKLSQYQMSCIISVCRLTLRINCVMIFNVLISHTLFDLDLDSFNFIFISCKGNIVFTFIPWKKGEIIGHGSKVLVRSDLRISSQDLFISGDVDEVLSRGALHQLKWCQLKGDLITGGKVSMLYLCKVPFGCQLGTSTEHFVQTSLSISHVLKCNF